MKLHPLEEAAKRHYGVTRDLHEAGFVLSDGTFLDLSGGIVGRKTRAHSELPEVLRRMLGKSGRGGLDAFLQQTGAIRVVPALGIEVMRMPTVEAVAAFVAGWKRTFGDDSVTVDVVRLDDTLVSQEIKDPEVDTLVEFMDAHFNSPSMGAPAQRLRFFSSCVNWPEDQVDDLTAMIHSGKQISRATFLKSVDPEEMRNIERELGYERDPRVGLTMAKDYHVAYYRSTVRGCPAVYFVWSAIEYVFTDLACLRSMPESEEEPSEVAEAEPSGKTFTIIERATQEAVFRDVPEGHQFFRGVERVVEGPEHHSELGVGEKMVVQIRSSGVKGVYHVWRTA